MRCPSKVRRRWRISVLVCAFLPWISGVARAAEPDADHSLLKRVSEQLVSVASPVPDYVWPPTFEILADKDIQAFASDERTPEERREGKKVRPRVVVHSATMTEVIQGDADRLALILGHELGHVVLRHIESPRGRTPFVQNAFTRAQEYAADDKGMELALAAGFSRLRGLKALRRAMELGPRFVSFEALGHDHPSWEDRLKRIDERDQAPLWQAMSAFRNGTYFLISEQYDSAEQCFKEVTKEFPGCPEAWANLGYTKLMEYCDKLDVDDLRRLDVGHLVIGGFYRTPGSLEAKLRGVDPELWWDAVGALREALRLKPDLILARSNLGVAYLVHPEGKDVGRATEYLLTAAEADKDLDPIARATVLINAGVAELAGGHPEQARRIFDRVENEPRSFPRSISGAVQYNRMLLLQASADLDDRRKALANLGSYLRSVGQNSAWWPLAYDRYATLCQALGQPPKSQDALRSQAPPRLKPLSAIELGPKTRVELGDRVSEVRRRLGTVQAVPVIARTNLVRLICPDRGIELLCTEQVLAICLRGPTAPPLSLRTTGLGANNKALRVGMAEAELDQVLKDQDYPVFKELIVPDVHYQYYRELGLAVRLRQGVVEELVIVQLPH